MTTRNACVAAIRDRQSFNLEVIHKDITRGAAEPLFFQFRSAHDKALDGLVPMIGIPANLTASKSDGACYYHGTLSTRKIDTASSSQPLVQQSAFSVVNDKMDPFEDVRLGAMLGRGAFGRVYRGQWKGTAVAVKVLEHNESADGEMMEALLSSKLSHPNVVGTPNKILVHIIPTPQIMALILPVIGAHI